MCKQFTWHSAVQCLQVLMDIIANLPTAEYSFLINFQMQLSNLTELSKFYNE